jgi:hypothetical protein
MDQRLLNADGCTCSWVFSSAEQTPRCVIDGNMRRLARWRCGGRRSTGGTAGGRPTATRGRLGRPPSWWTSPLAPCPPASRQTAARAVVAAMALQRLTQVRTAVPGMAGGAAAVAPAAAAPPPAAAAGGCPLERAMQMQGRMSRLQAGMLRPTPSRSLMASASRCGVASCSASAAR